MFYLGIFSSFKVALENAEAEIFVIGGGPSLQLTPCWVLLDKSVWLQGQSDEWGRSSLDEFQTVLKGYTGSFSYIKYRQSYCSFLQFSVEKISEANPGLSRKAHD